MVYYHNSGFVSAIYAHDVDALKQQKLAIIYLMGIMNMGGVFIRMNNTYNFPSLEPLRILF